VPLRYSLLGVQIPGMVRELWQFGEPSLGAQNGMQHVGLRTTPKGLGGAPFEHVRQRNARSTRSTWRGRNDGINTIGLDVKLGPTHLGDDAVALHTRWRNSLGRGEELLEFRVESPGVYGYRFQYVRLEAAMPDPDYFLLEIAGEAFEECTLGSDETYWRGNVHTETFAPTATAGLRAFADADVYNEGDVDTWGEYLLRGPGSYTIGTGADTVTLPTLAAGAVWDIGTDPEDFYIRDAQGVDRGELVGAKAWFMPILARTDTALVITATGTNADSRVEYTMPTYFQRAAA